MPGPYARTEGSRSRAPKLPPMRSIRALRSPLELGVSLTLLTLGIAAVVGLVAVLDADDVAGSFATGLGVAFVTFLVGATVVCALACLARGRLEIVALGSLLAAGLTLDLLVFAIWLEIENEVYAKFAGVAFTWSFFALIVLGLAIAVPAPRSLARPLYLAAAAATVGAGLISTWLIVTAGDDSGLSATGNPYFPYGTVGDDALLRALGAAFVLLAAFWFGTIAADRLERASRSESLPAATV